MTRSTNLLIIIIIIIIIMLSEASYINFSTSGFHIISENSFSNRVIDKWNQLPEDIVTCTSVNSFENRLDNFMHKRGFI